MHRLHGFLAGLVVLFGLGSVRADDSGLTTAQGVIEKVDRTTLTLKARAADGKPGRAQTFQITGTTWVTEVTLEKRGNKQVPVQRDLEVRDLKAGQSVALICTTTAQGQVVLTAVVRAPPEKESESPKQPPKAGALPRGVPEKVARVLAHLDAEDEAPEGYQGGRRFLNLGRDDEQVLPRRDANGRPISYREWDVNPLVPGRNRGAERLVTGTDGSAWYTADHYKTYTRIR